MSIINEYKTGWLAIKCECNSKLTMGLDPLGLDNPPPVHIRSANCPKCGLCFNVKIEVWKA